MNKRACRDCGYMLEISARGCPQCAMNVEAERLIDRFVWFVVAPAIILIVAGVIYFVFR